jgi:integrase
MAGKIRTREVCPQCGEPFTITEESDIFCLTCNTRPRTFYIFLYHKGKHRIARDQEGHILDSYRRAHRLLEKIRAEIDGHRFDVTRYLQPAIEGNKGYKLLAKWQRHKESDKISGWHKHKLSRYIEKYYEPVFGQRDMRDITTGDVEDFYRTLPEHLSAKTRKNIMDPFKSFLRWLYRRQTINRVPEFPEISFEEKPIRYITKKAQIDYLDLIPDVHKPIFSFLMWHPVRIGEACALQRKHFDTAAMIVEISQAVGFMRELKARKNKKPYYLPISSKFDLTALKGKLPEAFVFTQRNGKLYTSKLLGDIWRRSLDGKPYINLYNATRHSIASQAVNAGISLDRISKALGHSTLEMTKKYASMNVELLRDIVEPDSESDGSQVVQLPVHRARK